MKLRKRVASLFIASALVLTMTGCKKEEQPKTTPAPTTATTDKGGTDTGTDVAPETPDSGALTIDQLVLGETGKDLNTSIKVITQRTDIIDTVFQAYIVEFQKLYPGIQIEYEGITNYNDDMTMRLTTEGWGDICMLPGTVDKNEFPNKFISFGKTSELEKSYIMLNDKSFDGQAYGIPSTGNAQGIAYNKRIFSEAGIDVMPKTPEEFLGALQTIKDHYNGAVIPLYTNFAAEWTMNQWDAHISGTSTGDADYKNSGMVHAKEPFSKRDDMTGPYAVYYVMYEATVRGLIEDDPTTTDWEGSKGMINRGEIGTMVLGSWAVEQLMEAGDNPQDIGYMPFPITVGGKQYASAGPDYCYAINKFASDDNKLASMLYIKWLTEESGFSYDQGGLPINIGGDYPLFLDAFEGVDFVVDNPAAEGEETYFDSLKNEAELSFDADPTFKSLIIENALSGAKTFDDIMGDWNAKWSAAQQKLGIEVYE